MVRPLGRSSVLLDRDSTIKIGRDDLDFDQQFDEGAIAGVGRSRIQSGALQSETQSFRGNEFWILRQLTVRIGLHGTIGPFTDVSRVDIVLEAVRRLLFRNELTGSQRNPLGVGCRCNASLRIPCCT